MKLDEKYAELVQLMQKFEPRTRIGISGNERTRSTPLDPKLMVWCVFVAFGCICQCFVTTWNSVQNGLNWRNQCTSLCHKVASEFFCKECTRSTPLDPNSCSGAFRSVSVHLALFRDYTELGAKWVELVQLMEKFVPRNRIRVFHIERTRSTPLDAKLMNWFVM